MLQYENLLRIRKISSLELKVYFDGKESRGFTVCQDLKYMSFTMKEACDYIYSAGYGKRVKSGPVRIKELMELLGNPQDSIKFIHVAGTNGKGSVCAMLAQILSEAGYRTGLFTSPHLLRINERIKLSEPASAEGSYLREISDEDFAELAFEVKSAAEKMDEAPGYFEILTAIAFLYYKKKSADAVVLEVGLGGRYDATNIIKKPLLSVISVIDLEHTEVLGSTISEIAVEKAGIIKPGCPVVFQAQSREAESVFTARAKELESMAYRTEPGLIKLDSCSLENQFFSYRKRRKLRLGLLGSYQLKNAALVLDSIDVLTAEGFYIPETAVRKGLENVRWPGRFEILSRNPVVIIDGAHNPNGVKELSRCLKDYFPEKKFHFIMGVLSDKDYTSMLDIISPLAYDFTVVSPESSRALAAAELSDIIENKYAVRCFKAECMSSAISDCIKQAAADDIICIFGSLYQVAGARKYFERY